MHVCLLVYRTCDCVCSLLPSHTVRSLTDVHVDVRTCTQLACYSRRCWRRCTSAVYVYRQCQSVRCGAVPCRAMPLVCLFGLGRSLQGRTLQPPCLSPPHLTLPSSSASQAKWLILDVHDDLTPASASCVLHASTLNIDQLHNGGPFRSANHL